MNYPRLLNSTGKIQRSLYPINVSITLRSTPLSTATITLPKDEYLPARGFVELFTPYGSAGVFRVRSPHDAYGNETTTAELESAIAEVGDYLVKDEISKMMAATTAVQTLFKHYKGTRWKLGSVSALGTGKVAVEAKYTRVLDAILAVLEQKPNCILAFDYTTYPWTVSVVAKGITVTAEGRLERNVNYAQITYDDTDLCTRAYYQTYTTSSSGTATGKWTYKDASTKSKYGIVEKKLSTSSDLTASEIGTLVDTYLEEHKEPRISIDIDAEELSAVTGESIDKFTIGKLFRLVIPEYKVVVEKNITEVTWQDVYGNPKDVQLKLGKPEDTVITFLHDLDTTGSTSSSGGGGGGGGGGGNNADSKWKEYYTTFERTDDFIKMSAVRQDTTESILEQAGLELNSRGVLVYATDNKKKLGAQLNVHSDQIGMVVGTKNGKNFIKAGEIAVSINKAGASEAIINADHINISGTKDVQVLSKQLEYSNGKLVVKSSGLVARRNGVDYGVFDDGNLTGGLMVRRINGQTESYLKGDKIVIGNDGLVTVLNGKLNASAVTADYIASKIAQASLIAVTALTATGTVTAGDYRVSTSDGYAYLKNAGFSLGITLDSATNVYTLTMYNLEGNEKSSVTFSRATTLSGSWSGKTLSGEYYKVTASPQGDTKSSDSVTAVTSGSKSWASDNKSFTITIKAVAGGTTDLYSKSFEFDTTTSYNAGANYAKPVSWTAGSTGSQSQFTAKATSTGGGSASKTYCLVKNGSYVEVREGSQTGTRVARISIS